MAAQAIDDAFVEVGAKIGKFQSGMNKVAARLKQIGAKIAAFSKRAALALAVGFAAIGVSAVKLASAAEEIQGKFDTVFGNVAKATDEWAAAFGDAVKRNQNDVKAWLSTFQDTFVPLGLARDKAAEFSKTLTQLSVDVASFNDVSEADVIRDFQSALVGNTETVRKYGIIITAASVEQEILNKGWAKSKTEITELQKVQARLNLIMEGTADAQGDAIKTAGSFANQMRALKATYEETATEIGKAILDTGLLQKAMGKMIGVMKRLGDKFKELRDQRFFERMVLQSQLFFDNVKTTFKQIAAILVFPFDQLIITVKFVYASMVAATTNLILSLQIMWKNFAGNVTSLFKALWRKVTHPTEPFQMPDMKPFMKGVKEAMIDGPDSPRNAWKTMLGKMEDASKASNIRQKKLIDDFNAAGAKQAEDNWKKAAEVAKEAAKEVGEKVKEVGLDLQAGFDFELPHLTQKQVDLWGQFLDMLTAKVVSVKIDLNLPTMTNSRVKIWAKFFKVLTDAFPQTSLGGKDSISIGIDINLPTMTNSRVKIWEKFFKVVAGFKDLNVKIDIKLPKLTNQQLKLWKKFFDMFKDVKMDMKGLPKAAAAAAKAAAAAGKMPADAERAAKAAGDQEGKFNSKVIQLLQKAVTQRERMIEAIEDINISTLPAFGSP